MENELPDGAIEVVLAEDSRADGGDASAGPLPDASAQGGSNAGGAGNRSPLEQRIATLTARRHDAERGENEQRERADRLEAELARQRGQLDALAGRQTATESNVRQDYALRERAIKLTDIDGKLRGFAADKTSALEVSDYAKASDIDIQIAEALIEKRELEAASAMPANSGSRAPQGGGQGGGQGAEARPQDPRTAAFLARNQDWYGVDKAKTDRAWELHEQLKRERPDMVGSDAYWAHIENGVRRPEGGGGGGGNGRAAMPPLTNGGASTSGNGGGNGANPTRITLTREQAETARGLKLSPEQYARGLMKARELGELPVPR